MRETAWPTGPLSHTHPHLGSSFSETECPSPYLRLFPPPRLLNILVVFMFLPDPQLLSSRTLLLPDMLKTYLTSNRQTALHQLKSPLVLLLSTSSLYPRLSLFTFIQTSDLISPRLSLFTFIQTSDLIYPRLSLFTFIQTSTSSVH